MMKISIAVPSYNYSQFLESCFHSIQEQDYEDFEVLIADAGSTDGSLDIIKRICDEDQRFRLVSTGDKGQPHAVVKALALGTGDIFCFLNADDCYICRDALSSVVSAFKAYPHVDLVTFAGYYITSKGRYTKPVRYRYHPLDSVALMRYRTAVLQPSTFWTRDVHENIPIPVDFHFAFDAVFFYNAYCQYSLLELQKPIAGYRLHGYNKSLSIKSNRIFELARFERIKFGSLSLRAFYLTQVGWIVRLLEQVPVIGLPLRQLVYRVVNSLAFLTVYRLPNI